jgi:hypothetical protein
MHLAATKDQESTSPRHTTARHRFATSFPPTPVERAIASARWERRGLLGRLVRLDAPSSS